MNTAEDKESSITCLLAKNARHAVHSACMRPVRIVHACKFNTCAQWR